MQKADIKWNCASYSRLSREDKDGSESNSITNQKDLIREYIKSVPEFCLSLEIEDDGFSGVDFFRPGFEILMEEIKSGKINCVIVKDLSRFGRNYIEVGGYIDKIFPFMGVRFIAINDNYDSLNGKSSSDEVLIPFKNLVNEIYLRDTSIKIRSQFEIKRKKGEFVGAFAPYGYKKDINNKGRLVIDCYAATVVEQIFKWKIEGYSHQVIANMLNERGEPAPYEYRKQNGENYDTPFKKKATSEWTAKAIGRLLENPVYMGTLVQGKITTPNHKVKKTIVKPKEEWVVVKDNHEAVIKEELFDIVSGLLKSDTRLGAHNKKLYLFSGIVFCGDCGSSMCRKTVPSKGKKYQYLVCSGHKQFKNCSTHSYNESKLADVVFTAIKCHIKCVLKCEEVINNYSSDFFKTREIKGLRDNLQRQIEEVETIGRHKMNLYEDLKNGILTKIEYEKYHKIYSQKLDSLDETVITIQSEIEKKELSQNRNNSWIEHFKKHKDIKELSRNLIVSLIKEITVYEFAEDYRIEIEFFYQDKFDYCMNIVENMKSNIIQLESGVNTDAQS